MTVLYDSGQIYVGQGYNSIKHGKGILSLSDSFTADGVWENNHLIKGKLHDMESCIIYEGEFLNGKKHGRGKQEFYDVTDDDQKVVYSSYDGFWKNDKRHGNGILSDERITYSGGWVEGRRHGKCQIRFKTDDTVIKGIIDGCLIKGTWENKKSQQSYKGDLIFNNKEWTFANYGVYKEIDSVTGNPTIYEGFFVDSNRHGQGKWTDTVTNYYLEGTFDKDIFVGGKCSFSEHTYILADKMAIRHIKGCSDVIVTGENCVYYREGYVYEGSLLYTYLTGKIKITYPSGEVYEGSVHHSIQKHYETICPDGWGEMKHTDGSKITCRWNENYPVIDDIMVRIIGNLQSYSNKNKYSVF
jgi:hypothetical protein